MKLNISTEVSGPYPSVFQLGISWSANDQDIKSEDILKFF